MKIARVVFLVAGLWGIVVLTPLYFLVDLTGRQYAAPVDYPQFFYGFLSVAMAWQIAFLVIGSSPARFRPLMIPSIVEKLAHVAGVAVLYGQGRLSVADATAAGPDLLLGVLFIMALFTSGPMRFRHAVLCSTKGGCRFTDQGVSSLECRTFSAGCSTRSETPDGRAKGRT